MGKKGWNKIAIEDVRRNPIGALCDNNHHFLKRTDIYSGRYRE